MNPSVHNKSALRGRFAMLRDSLPPHERATAEAVIYERLFSLPVWKAAPLICGYASTRSELDTTPIWRRAIADGKTYALPVTVTDAREGQMIFRVLSGYEPDRLTAARFGLKEPDESCPTLCKKDFTNALILVPALAFDNDGYRLGYGGGYYDRFLRSLQAANIPIITVGAVFAACRTDILPRESHDIPVDLIIDERRIVAPYGFHEHP